MPNIAKDELKFWKKENALISDAQYFNLEKVSESTFFNLKKKIFSLANTFEFLDFNLRRDWLLDITSIGIWVLVYVTSEVNIYNTLSCLIDAFSHQLEGLV